MAIDPKNLSAQMAHRAAGNPPSTLPSAAISNFFPGLEFDFRNAWRRILVGVELHEASIEVVRVEAGSSAEQQGVQAGHLLLAVNGERVFGDSISDDGVKRGDMPLEWSNSLAVALRGPGPAACVFQRGDSTVFAASLDFAQLFDGAAIAEALAQPGELTQSLCSPWQADYRECGCFYWAASRPDYVNVEDQGNGAEGHSWLHKGRTAATPKGYIPESPPNALIVTYEDLYQAWETHLKFIIEGKDET